MVVMESQVQQGHQALWAPLAHRGIGETGESQDHEDTKGRSDHKELQESLEPTEMPVCLELVVFQAQLDLQETQYAAC